MADKWYKAESGEIWNVSESRFANQVRVTVYKETPQGLEEVSKMAMEKAEFSLKGLTPYRPISTEACMDKAQNIFILVSIEKAGRIWLKLEDAKRLYAKLSEALQKAEAAEGRS